MKLIINDTNTPNNDNEDLKRAIVISLFTWKRADPTDIYDGNNKYGWWGDSFPYKENDKIGSKLWQLIRTKITDDIIMQAQEMCEEALAWLIEDGIVDSLNVSISRLNTDKLEALITLYQNEKTTKFKIEDLLNGNN